jgi:hypothetical protein
METLSVENTRTSVRAVPAVTSRVPRGPGVPLGQECAGWEGGEWGEGVQGPPPPRVADLQRFDGLPSQQAQAPCGPAVLSI